MIAFSFNAAIEMTMTNKGDGSPSRVEESRFSLGVSPNLKQEAYLREDGLPTPEGVKILGLLLGNAITAIIKFAEHNGYPAPEAILPAIQKTIDRGLALDAKVGAGTMDDPTDKRPRKSTDKELVEELRARNNVYQYDELIRNAVAKRYHDFKAPEDVVCGKVLLVEELARFPELSDIREKVIAGEYDEAPDEEDRKEMAEWLLGEKGGHTDKMAPEDKLPYSPKLKTVMEKIKEAVLENDVGALVVLHTPGYAEDYVRLDPSYSCIKVAGNRVHFRAKLEDDFAGDLAAQEKKVAATMNMLSLLSDIGKKDALHLLDIHTQAQVYMDVQNTPPTFTPNNN